MHLKMYNAGGFEQIQHVVLSASSFFFFFLPHHFAQVWFCGSNFVGIFLKHCA